MNTNKTFNGKIKKIGIALSLVFSFGLLSSVEANAQTYRQQRQENRQDRREDRRDASAEGYRDGLREGREDAEARRRRNATGENSYRGANGHNSRTEINAYRAAFVRGYNESYTRYMRNRRGY